MKCLEDRTFRVLGGGVPSLEGFRSFDAKGSEVVVVPVPLRFFEDGGSVEELQALRRERPKCEGGIVPETIFIYEDRWLAAGPLVRSMLAVRLGRGESIYARNCEVREIPAQVAAEFLERNHLYGSTRSAYRYGLFRRRATGRNEAQMMDTAAMVAVATFSAGKPFSDGTLSYEWIRYASAKGTRVVGGMGRLLDTFVSRMRSDARIQVMSYADMEWTTGESYLKLGFEAAGERPSVEFLCDPATMQRVHAGKFFTDRKFRAQSTDGYLRICNLGSRKFVQNYESR